MFEHRLLLLRISNGKQLGAKTVAAFNGLIDESADLLLLCDEILDDIMVHPVAVKHCTYDVFYSIEDYTGA